MGEYAVRKADGQRVKIGTCEDLFSLRYDQIDRIDGSAWEDTDPRTCLGAVRFRFPWPDEDDVRPGDFGDSDRDLGLYVKAPEGVKHGLVQFTARNGYLASLPCPEDPAYEGPTVHRNGYGGAVHVTGQAVRHGALVLTCKCGGCRRPFNVPPDEAEPYLAELDERWAEVGRRARAGYALDLRDGAAAGPRRLRYGRPDGIGPDASAVPDGASA